MDIKFGLKEFDILVKKNKKRKKHWYDHFKGSWWKGMSENAARQKIIEINNIFDIEGVAEDEIEDGNEVIAICVMIRNEERFGHLKRFIKNCKEIEKHYDNLVYIIIEGDSYDDTYKVLKKWLNGDEDGKKDRNYILKKYDRGYDKFPKNRDTRRTKYFAEVRNMLIDYVLEIPDISLVFMVDASYGFKGNIIGDLEKTMKKDGADIVAPLNCTHKDHTGKFMFYDIFAYRKNGKEFTNRWPYHNEIEKELKSGKSVRIDSCGGGYLIKKEVLDVGVRYNGNKDCEHVGFCKKARDKGFVIKLNTKISIRKGGDVD